MLHSLNLSRYLVLVALLTFFCINKDLETLCSRRSLTRAQKICRDGPGKSHACSNIYFDANTHHPSLVVQPSGAGKSRTLAECLHRHWGLYFTCARDAGTRAGAGSVDLYEAVMSSTMTFRLYRPLREGDETLRQKRAENLWQAHDQVERVLKARFVFLRFFLKVGKELELSEPHLRKCWVHLQLNPRLLSGTDIFAHFVTQLNHAPGSDLSWAPEWIDIHATLNLPGGTRPLVILDEAQQAARSHTEYFRDDTGKEPRPILRELVQVLNCYTYLIVSGPGLSMRAVGEESTSSSVSKIAAMGVVHLHGGFDDSQKIRAYVEAYVPKEVITDRLLDRLYLWLRGRYIFGTM
jgi:hypothetical protein